MKIAIFHELDFGGARRTVEEFAKRLDKIFDVDLYYVAEKKDEVLKKGYKNVFYYPFFPKFWKGKDWKVRLYKDTVELVKLSNLHKKIAQDIKSKNYDYIFVHPSKFTQAPFLLRFLKNKCIYYCQEPLRIVYDKNLSDLSFVKFHKKIYEFLIRKIRKRIDLKNIKDAWLVLANSKFSRDFIEKSYRINAKVCYLGVDTGVFKPLNTDKPHDILFIGNEDEGYGLLSDALKLFKKKPRVKTIFREKRQFISDNDLVAIYNESRILVALNKNEPFGLIVLEAMACGIPVIAIGEGGYNESIINNKTGFLIPRDPAELYNKISQIISNEKLRRDLGKNARENIMKNWTWNKTIDRFLHIIKYEK